VIRPAVLSVCKRLTAHNIGVLTSNSTTKLLNNSSENVCLGFRQKKQDDCFELILTSFEAILFCEAAMVVLKMGLSLNPRTACLHVKSGQQIKMCILRSSFL